MKILNYAREFPIKEQSIHRNSFNELIVPVYTHMSILSLEIVKTLIANEKNSLSLNVKNEQKIKLLLDYLNEMK